jgi:hypothetical protein
LIAVFDESINLLVNFSRIQTDHGQLPYCSLFHHVLTLSTPPAPSSSQGIIIVAIIMKSWPSSDRDNSYCHH